VEEAAADAAFLETAALAADRYGIDAQTLVKAVREQARPLWHASPAREYCVRVGPSSWEGLWARYEGDDPNLKILRDWAPTYRLGAWSAALEQFEIHDPALALILAEDFPKRRRQHHRLYPDALPILNALRGRFKLGLVTNGLSCLQREKIQGVGIAPYFDSIAISGDLGIGKPQPAIFHAVLDPFAVRPDQALMIGNSIKADIGGAQAIGMKTILIDRGDPHGKDDTIRPDAIVHDLAGVMEYLGTSGLTR
jgi:putative hydrolase of the HAD superfamily